MDIYEILENLFLDDHYWLRTDLWNLLNTIDRVLEDGPSKELAIRDIQAAVNHIKCGQERANKMVRLAPMDAQELVDSQSFPVPELSPEMAQYMEVAKKEWDRMVEFGGGNPSVRGNPDVARCEHLNIYQGGFDGMSPYCGDCGRQVNRDCGGGI